jgi:NAD-dependent oxidoreductase involved in siderophore biosynthesis
MALSAGHPMMIAWSKFCETDEFKSALKWAVAKHYDDGRPIHAIQREQHAKGAMWLAFTAGMEVDPNA